MRIQPCKRKRSLKKGTINPVKRDNWKVLGLIAFILIIAIDTWTKYWALGALQQAPISIGSFLGIDLSLTLTTNQGAAWGVASSIPKVLLAIRCIIILGLVWFLYSPRCPISWKIPLCCAIAGALSNIRDTFLWGHVVDMFDVRLFGYDYPVFNVADIAITLSVLVLFFRCRKK